MKPELLEGVQLTKESKAKQLHWTQPHRDKQMHLLKLQELKRVPHASIPADQRGRLPAQCSTGNKPSDTAQDESAQKLGVKPQLRRPPPKPENFSLPAHAAEVESTYAPFYHLHQTIF